MKYQLHKLDFMIQLKEVSQQSQQQTEKTFSWIHLQNQWNHFWCFGPSGWQLVGRFSICTSQQYDTGGCATWAAVPLVVASVAVATLPDPLRQKQRPQPFSSMDWERKKKKTFLGKRRKKDQACKDGEAVGWCACIMNNSRGVKHASLGSTWTTILKDLVFIINMNRRRSRQNPSPSQKKMFTKHSLMPKQL